MASLIWMPKRVMSACAADADLYYPLESGGAFLGYRVGGEIVVTEMVTGGLDALRTRASYQPDVSWQNARIAEHYARSGRKDEYLGDWHSHPDTQKAYLSRDDHVVLRKIIRTPGARCPRPVMSVLAGTKSNWSMTIWSAALTRRRWLGQRLLVTPESLAQYED
jgi:integrative and conjugative element protein (TIGR02256 family)